jgi:hypothetical protein
VSKFGGGSWGSWHTSDVIRQPCPQGCPRDHTVEEAVALNDKEREYQQARMYARTKEWMSK